MIQSKDIKLAGQAFAQKQKPEFPDGKYQLHHLPLPTFNLNYIHEYSSSFHSETLDENLGQADSKFRKCLLK